MRILWQCIQMGRIPLEGLDVIKRGLEFLDTVCQRGLQIDDPLAHSDARAQLVGDREPARCQEREERVGAAPGFALGAAPGFTLGAAPGQVLAGEIALKFVGTLFHELLQLPSHRLVHRKMDQIAV